MILKIIFFILFIIILFLLFFWISKRNIPFIEHFSNIALYDNIYITNTINNNVICIESGNNGLIISMTSSVIGSSPTYYSTINMNLNGNNLNGYNDIVTILCANGNYWYFNYGSSYATKGNAPSGTSNEKATTPIDLSQVPASSIFENALLFENGSMITFDITGTHMIISTVPVASTPQKVQCIFALGSCDKNNLSNNTMVLLNIAGNLSPPANYFYYSGQSGFNKASTNNNGGVLINPFETTAIYVPNNTRQGIIQFTNGCFIDGSIATFSNGQPNLRFIGMGGIINFLLDGTQDIFQIWNPILSNYFYYNNQNNVGNTNTKNNMFTKPKKQTYWNMSYANIGGMSPVNLLPYTPQIGNSIDSNNNISYRYIDQVLIYNPKSTNNYAILLQVDTCLWGQNIGNMVQGTNNYSLTLSSVLYNPTNQTISSNPNAISKFSFNFNCGEGDLIGFIVNNGKSSNNYTNYYYYNGPNNKWGNNLSKGSSNPYGISTSGGQTFSVMPNNLPWNASSTNLSTASKNIYAFRNTTPNLLVFENTINLQGGIQIGIDTNGNCIWKGSVGQLEFNLVQQNMGNNFNICGITSNGTVNLNLNNWTYNGKNAGKPLLNGTLNSGILHHVTAWGVCDINHGINQRTVTNTTGDFMVGANIEPSSPSSWPCSNVTALNANSNNLYLTFPNGYKDKSGGSLNKNALCVLEPFTPLQLVSQETNKNIVNGNTINNPIKQIMFSNGMNLTSNNGDLYIQGLYGSYFTTLNNSSGSFVQVQNSMIRNGGSNQNCSINYTGSNGFRTTSITSNTYGITFS